MLRWIRLLVLGLVCTIAYPLLAQSSTMTIKVEVVPDFHIDGSVPNAALLTDANGVAQVVLLYTVHEGLAQATATDGLTFSGLNKPFTAMLELFRAKQLFPTDVLVRQTASGSWRYFVKGLPPPGSKIRSLYAVDRAEDGTLSFLNDGQPVYTGRVGGAGRVEVPEIIITPEDTWRMFYVGMGESVEITHSAISTDEGLTWTFEKEAVFGDQNPKPGPRAEQFNVDPAPFRLNDGSYVAATMRAGKIFFWTSGDGLNFSPIAGAVLAPEDINVTGVTDVRGLFDPTWVQLPDGTLYLYVTAGAEARGAIIAARVTLSS